MSKPPRTKASIIREYLTTFVDLMPAQIAEMIRTDMPGLKVGPQDVSTIKSEMAKKAKKEQTAAPPAPAATEATGGPEGPGAPSSAGTAGLADRMAELKRAADALGGPAEAKRILDLLK